MRIPLKIEKSLEMRKESNTLRVLRSSIGGIDFSSNDYLGFASSTEVYNKTNALLAEINLKKNGATGSRLLSGNHVLYAKTEDYLANFHRAQAALIFNSGYDANLGFFSSVPQREDVVLYDELVHASIRDGISGGKAKAYKFRHNDLEDLGEKIKKHQSGQISGETYIVTESVFSMDGDSPNLVDLVNISEKNNCFLVIDEAHAVGVYGDKGEGLVQHLNLQERVFARIITFGKALGSHGAVILGDNILKEYLVNFARSIIYTTALPPHSLACILAAYTHLQEGGETSGPILNLIKNIKVFKNELEINNLRDIFIKSDCPIQCCIVPGNEEVKRLASNLQEAGFDVKAILSPTVPKGQERLRICIHSFNTAPQIRELVKIIGTIR